jgi:hypothetical protein
MYDLDQGEPMLVEINTSSHIFRFVVREIGDELFNKIHILEKIASKRITNKPASFARLKRTKEGLHSP